MMIGGLFWWNRYRALNYTVEMDVNPSIELRVNKAEKVISPKRSTRTLKSFWRI